MVMYFQDDFWEAIKSLPEKDRKDAALALIEYHFEGTGTNQNPVANAILAISKKRIDLSKTRSKAKKGKTKSKSDDNQNEIKTESKSEETQTSHSLSLSNSYSQSISYKDDDIDWENPNSELADFVALALDIFNEETNSDLMAIDYVTQESLREIMERGRMANDLRAVVRCKYKQWIAEEKSIPWIRPSTMYSKDHFEEYLAESKRQAKAEENTREEHDADLDEYLRRLDF